MPITCRGRTATVAFTAGSRKLASIFVPYLPFMSSMTRCMRAGSVTIAAVPSTMTGSLASSVLTTQRGSDFRFLILRELTRW